MASFLSDLFGGANNAAKDQTAGIQQGLVMGTNAINAGDNALTSNYTQALQPYLQNNQTAQQGTTALGNLLGLNGAAGSQSAQTALQKMPGYQFALQQGDNSVNAAAAANGTLNSGNQLMALSKYNQGLASQNYNNYVSQLQPYMNMATSSAQGIGNTYQGLGNSLNSNQLAQAGMDVGAMTGIGNAQANADLTNQSMGMGLLGGVLGLGSSGGSSLLGGIGSSLMGGIGSGISSLAGLNMYGSGSVFSDERLKEDIEPVGELFDGTNIYRYRYKGDDTPHIGVMAQEIEKRTPGAVHEIGGFKAVNYAAATDFAAELGKFVGDFKAPNYGRADSMASELSKFLKEAA